MSLKGRLQMKFCSLYKEDLNHNRINKQRMLLLTLYVNVNLGYTSKNVTNLF